MSGKITKSKKQVGYLLSSGSPLTASQQSTLKSELKSGDVKVAHKGPGRSERMKTTQAKRKKVKANSSTYSMPKAKPKMKKKAKRMKKSDEYTYS